MSFNPVRDHPINETLKRLIALQSSAILSGPDSEIDERRRWYLEKIFYLAQKAKSAIKKRLSYSVSTNALTNLNSSAESIINELNNFIVNRSISHLDNAFNQVEQGFQIYMDQAIPRNNSGPNADAENLIESLQKSYQASISALKTERDKLATDLKVLSGTVSTNIETISSLQKDIERHRTESEEVISQISGTYEKFQESISSKFDENLAQWTVEKSKAVADITTASDTLVSQISKKEGDARALVQSVGDILTTGTYAIRADKESELSDKFRLITIGLFAIGIIIVLSNFAVHAWHWLKGTDFQETPWTLVTRFLTALVVALPALYTARESARHRTNADRATQRALELSTLGPFIELMPDEAKADIRNRLTDKYFGNAIEAHKVDSPLDPETIAKLAEALAKVIKPA
jgi:hypothetical protein